MPVFPENNIHHLTQSVTLCIGAASNWVVVQENGRYILIDCGYPTDNVLGSIATIGLEGMPEALLLTHGHIDHLGGAAPFIAAGVPILCNSAEIANATGAVSEQINESVALQLASENPLWAAWAQHAIAAGAKTPVKLPSSSVRAYEESELHDLPGKPSPIVTGAHTSGHTAFMVDSVLVSGDILISGHITSELHDQAQLLHAAFHHCDIEDVDAAARKLLQLEFDYLAPGHGLPITQKDLQDKPLSHVA